MIPDSAVGIVTGYGLDGRRARVRDSIGERNFLLHVFQTDAVLHPASYPMSTWCSFKGNKLMQWSKVQESTHKFPQASSKHSA
jgi:hypothetical protein